MAGEVRGELGRRARRTLGYLQELRVVPLGAETHGLERELREGLAPPGGVPLLGGELDRPLEVATRMLRVPGPRAGDPAPGLEAPRPERRRALDRGGGGPVEPRRRLLVIADVRVREGRAARGEELERPVADRPGLLVRLLASRDRQVGDHLGAGEHVDPVQELRLECGLLALVGERLHRRDDPPDLLDVPPRARSHVDVGGPAQVAHRDDRGHRAAPVAQPLEDLERLLEAFGGLLHVGGDRQLAHHVVERLPRRDPAHVRHVLARVDPVDEPPADPAELHHAELTERGGEARVVAELAGQLARRGRRPRRRRRDRPRDGTGNTPRRAGS